MGAVEWIALSAFVLMIWGVTRCKHAWELVDKTQLPSKLEMYSKYWKPTTLTGLELSEAAKINATLVIRCSKCGHCKIIHMSNE